MFSKLKIITCVVLSLAPVFAGEFLHPADIVLGSFENDSDSQGWNDAKHVTFDLTSADDVLHFTIDGDDPYITYEFPNITGDGANPDCIFCLPCNENAAPGGESADACRSLKAEKYSYIKVRIRHDVDSGTHMRIFFKTATNNSWHPDRSVTRTIQNDGQFHTYVFSMDGNSNWLGRITGLRFDLAEGATRDKTGDLDFIAISPYPQATEVLGSFNANGQVENWQPTHPTTFESEDGVLKLNIVDEIPSIIKSGLNYDVQDFGIVSIRLKNTTPATQASIYYGTTNPPNFSQAQRITFPIKPDSNTFETYTINMLGEPLSGTTITALRLDLDFSTATAENPAFAELDHFLFLPYGDTLNNDQHDKPSLLFDLASFSQEVRGKHSQNPRTLKIYEELMREADHRLTTPSLGYGGRRRIFGRAASVYLLNLAMAGLETDDDAYSDKAIALLMQIVNENGLDQYRDNDALSLGDMAHAMAMAYDWLSYRMTSQERFFVRRELEEIGMEIYYRSTNCCEAWCHTSERRKSWNWNGVVHGGLGLIALVLDRQDWLDRATERSRDFLIHSVDADGAGFEGFQYAGYGLQHVIPFAVALSRKTNGQIDLLNEPETAKNLLRPNWLMSRVLPGGCESVSINRSAGTWMPAGGIYYLIMASENEEALWSWLQLLGPNANCPERTTFFGRSSGWLGNGVSLAYVYLWDKPSLNARNLSTDPIEKDRASLMQFEKGEVSIRNGWQDMSSLVTFNGRQFDHSGTYSDADISAFTFHASGESFAVDSGLLGGGSEYHNIIHVNQNGQNWANYPDNPLGSLLAADFFGENQVDGVYSVADATTAYHPNVGIEKITRTIISLTEYDNVLIIGDVVDMIDNVSTNHEFQFNMHVDPELHLFLTYNTPNQAQILGKASQANVSFHSEFPIELVAADGYPNPSKLKAKVQGNRFRLFTIIEVAPRSEVFTPKNFSVDWSSGEPILRGTLSELPNYDVLLMAEMEKEPSVYGKALVPPPSKK